ncbi:DUF2249 domain-containing protein [Haladaptatus sp. NG-SE-30]
MTTEVHELDVRQIEQPFDDIMSAVTGLKGEQTLVLINSFEPQPLYSVLEKQGFQCEAEKIDADEWHISVTRT